MGRYDKDFEEFENLQKEQSLFDEFESQEEEKNKRNVSDAIYPETTEGKYLQPLYDIAEPVVKGLSVLEKPLSTAMAAGKTLGRGFNELSGVTDEGFNSVIEPLKQEAMSGIFPAPENSISSAFRDLEIGTDPLLEGALPESVKAQFPKASAMVESFAPVDALDMAASGVYGSKLPKMSKGQLSDMKAADPIIAKNALIRGSQRDVKFVGELQSSGKLDSLANKVISNQSVRNNLTNPEKMIEYLQGVNREVTDPVTGFRNRISVVPGKLDEIGNELSARIKKIGSTFDSDNFKKNVTSDLMQESDEIGSGIKYDMDSINKEVDKYIKLTSDKQRSFSDLVKIKRGAADRIFKMKQAGFANVENPTFAEAVAQKIWSESDNQIKKMASEANDFDTIKLNNEFSDFSKIRELYANKDIAKKYVPSLLEDIIPAAAVGGVVGIATGNPYLGAVAAGGYPMTRSGVGAMANNFPSMALNSRIGTIEPALRAASQIKPGVAAGAMMMSQIPRETDKILAMKDKFLTAIARETKTPQGETLFNEVVRTINTNPAQLKSIMPLIMQSYPQIFVPDPYNRIDGEISDPILKQKAIEKIINDEPSALEGAKQMQLLLNGNKYYGG